MMLLSYLARSGVPQLAACAFAVAACGPPPPRPSIHAGHVVAQRAFRTEGVTIDAKNGKRRARFPADGWADAAPSAGGLVFLHGDAGLAGRDVATGDVKWRVLVKASYLMSPVVGGASVFVFDPSESQHAWRGYAAADGRKTFDVPCDDYEPLSGSGDVLVTFQDDELTVRSAADGKELYRIKEEAEPPVLVAGDRLYARVGDQLGVFKIDNGRLVRRVGLPDTDAFDRAGPVALRMAASPQLVAYLADETAGAIDAASGEELWTKPVEGADTIAMDAGIVAIASGDRVTGLDARTGAKKWETAMDPGPTGVAAAEGLVAVRADGSIVVLDLASGRRRFAFDLAAEAVTRSP